jgi:hypothetical protein
VLTNIKARRGRHVRRMSGVIYQCPNMRLRIRALMADDVTEDADLYVPVTCVRCRQVHHVNPLTGNVVGIGNAALSRIEE